MDRAGAVQVDRCVRRTRVLAWWAIALAILLDVVLVIIPQSRGRHRYVYWTFYLTNFDTRSNIRHPSAEVVSDGMRLKIVYHAAAEHEVGTFGGDYACLAGFPAVFEAGLFTPWYASSMFDFEVISTADGAVLPQSDVAVLRREYVEQLLADPWYGAFSDVSLRALANPGVKQTEISWLLLANDILFVSAIGVFMYLTVSSARCGLRLRRLARVNLCPECGYNLSDQRDRGCPECGWLRE